LNIVITVTGDCFIDILGIITNCAPGANLQILNYRIRMTVCIDKTNNLITVTLIRYLSSNIIINVTPQIIADATGIFIDLINLDADNLLLPFINDNSGNKTAPQSVCDICDLVPTTTCLPGMISSN